MNSDNPQGSESALVLGATGFVGKALVRHLLARGWAVDVLAGERTDTAEVATLVGHARVHANDGSRSAIDAALTSARPSVVFHLASRIQNQHTAADIRPILDANVRLGTELADAMVQAGLHRLVVAGSNWQHYRGADYSPVNLYAATKQAYQTILAYYTEATALRVRLLTLSHTYGPNDPRRKVLDLLYDAARTGLRLQASPGRQLIDIVHVEDVAAAFVATARTFDTDPAVCLEFSASSGSAIPLRDVVPLFERVIGTTIPVEWDAVPYPDRTVMEPWRGIGPPGWTPRIALEDGLREVYAPLTRAVHT